MWTSTGLTVATNEAGLLVVRDNTAVTDAPHRFLRLRVQTAP